MHCFLKRKKKRKEKSNKTQNKKQKVQCVDVLGRDTSFMIENNSMTFVTGCYDGVIRLWKIPPENSFVCMCFNLQFTILFDEIR